MLSLDEMGQAQKTYRKFIFFNTLSFNLMTGNVVNLYAMRLGADAELIGILAAMGSLNFFFSFLGRRIIYRMGAVKLMGTFWSLRYLMMVPVIFTVFPEVRNIPVLPLALIVMGTFFFNFSKGIALSASKPIVGSLAYDRERAHFTSGNQTWSFVGTTLANLYIAIMLGKESPISRYLIIIASGIMAGLIAASFIFRLPEPQLLSRKGNQSNFLQGARDGFKKKSFRELMIIMIITNLGTTLTNPFFVVYAKQALFFSDQTVVIITTIASVGVLFVAYLSRLLMDRVGSKPLFFTFNLLKIFLLLLVIAVPVGGSQTILIVYMTFVFLINHMCFHGILSSSDIYFFVTSTPEERVDQGIVFNLAKGVSGLLGSIIGGFLLGYLQRLFLSPVIPFQLYFALGILFHGAALLRVRHLPDVSRFSIRSVLGILLSPRDLRAIWHLNRLEKSTSPEEEQEHITRISENLSSLTLEELQNRMESPAMFTRLNAINSLRRFPVNERTEELLMEQVKYQPYTSGHQAAALLGELDIKKAIPVLREALNSDDYLLKSKAAVALGRLNDSRSRHLIEAILLESDNPRLILHSARALELMGSLNSLPLILNKIKDDNIPHVNDELILIISGLLGFSDWYFPCYTAFLGDEQEGWNRLESELPSGNESAPLTSLFNRVRKDSTALDPALKEYLKQAKGHKKKDPLLSAVISRETTGGKKEIPFLLLARLIRA